MSNLIACPNCRHEIAVNEVVQSQLSKQIRRDIEVELQSEQAGLIAAKKKLAVQEASLANQQADFAATVSAGIEAARSKITAEAEKKAKESFRLELQDQAAKVGDRTFTSERHAPFGIPSTLLCLYAGTFLLSSVHFSPECSVRLGECDDAE